jgi:histidyl-tRNA synthetase
MSFFFKEYDEVLLKFHVKEGLIILNHRDITASLFTYYIHQMHTAHTNNK